MYETYESRGVEFIGLTGEDSSALDDSKAFLEACGVKWSNGYGAAEPIETLNLNGIPTIFVIGADGKVLWHDELDGTVEEALDAALWLRENPE